jgi:hypothetical protein
MGIGAGREHKPRFWREKTRAAGHYSQGERGTQGENHEKHWKNKVFRAAMWKSPRQKRLKTHSLAVAMSRRSRKSLQKWETQGSGFPGASGFTSKMLIFLFRSGIQPERIRFRSTQIHGQCVRLFESQGNRGRFAAARKHCENLTLREGAWQRQELEWHQ